FFFSSRRRHTIFKCDWSSDVCSSDLGNVHIFRIADNIGCHIPMIERGGLASCFFVLAVLDEIPLFIFDSFSGVGGPITPGCLIRSEERRVGKECIYGWWWVSYKWREL